jgi:hypothetical protein
MSGRVSFSSKKCIFINEINGLLDFQRGGTAVAIETMRRPCLAREWRHEKTNIGTKGTSGSRLRNLLFNLSFFGELKWLL